MAKDDVEESPEVSVSGEASRSVDRDVMVMLADLEKEKKTVIIKAWVESEKSKAEKKAQKKISDVLAWENSKKAANEEKLERKKTKYVEKMKNKDTAIHKQAEEKRAMIEDIRKKEILKAEEMATKYRDTGTVPPKPTFGFF